MLVALNALQDNYIWLYANEQHKLTNKNLLPLLVIDPTEAAPVLNFLQQHPACSIEAILLTHNHHDHIGGVAELRQHYPHLQVYGPKELAHLQINVVDVGELITEHYHIQVLATGGHTAGHISFLVDNHLFCGDTLFSAGCGRVFTGDYKMMFESLQRLRQLPAQTVVCPAHEYTLSNLKFVQNNLAGLALNVDKSAVEQQQVWVEQQSKNNLPSLPTTLRLEKQINPFLMADNLAQFTLLRQAKDNA